MPTQASAPAPTASTPRLPRKFGRYALFDFIGKGGMAEIYLARAKTDLGAVRLCVVKQILPELALHPQFADMLIHEAKLAARLNHANIVQVFDLGRADERLFIAMDYIEGFDLNDLLRRCSRTRTPLPFEFALRVIADVLTGLGCAHRRVDDAGKPLGIVHRDVSPSNILISFEGEVKVCDFGIAHANDIVTTEADSQVDDAIKGKAGYMSPEHARGEPIDARADVFAVGIVLWELVSGRRMYKADTGKPPLLEQARLAEIPDVARRGLPLEDKLRAIAFKALAVNRDERYASAAAMLRDIEDYMREAKLMASALRFGEWIVDKFGADIVAQRRARERAIDALERGAPVSLVPLPPAPTPLPSMVPAGLVDPPPSSDSVPHISSTPPPTPVPQIPPPPIVPRSRYAAAIDRHALSAGPSSIAAVDVSPPSSQLGAPRVSERPPRRSRAKYVVVAVMVLVLAAVVVALVMARM